MHGNTFTRSIRGITFIFRRPKDGIRYLVNWLDRKSPLAQGLPWFSYPSIDFLDSYVKPDMRVFEWGVGGSNLWEGDSRWLRLE